MFVPNGRCKSLVTMTRPYVCLSAIESLVDLVDVSIGGPTTCSMLLSSYRFISDSHSQSYTVLYIQYHLLWLFLLRPTRWTLCIYFVHILNPFLHLSNYAFSCADHTHIWKHLRMRINNFLIISILQHWRLISQKAVLLWVHMSQQSQQDTLFKTSLMWKWWENIFLSYSGIVLSSRSLWLLLPFPLVCVTPRRSNSAVLYWKLHLGPTVSYSFIKIHNYNCLQISLIDFDRVNVVVHSPERDKNAISLKRKQKLLKLIVLVSFWSINQSKIK